MIRTLISLGTDKLTYFRAKSGNSKRVKQHNKARSGTRIGTSGHLSPFFVASAHDLKLN